MDTAMRSQRTAHQIASCPKGTEIYLLFFPHEDGVPVQKRLYWVNFDSPDEQSYNSPFYYYFFL